MMAETKEANTERTRKYREENRDAYNAYMREYARKNKDRINERRRELRKKNPEKYREHGRRRYWKDPLKNKLYKFNINKEQYNQMFTSQDGKCAICNNEMKVINIDHCHETNIVRGLLCTSCNTGIGKLKEDINIMKSAINYLTKR